MTSYNGRHFKYSIRKFMFGKEAKFFVNLYIECNGVTYQLAQKNNYNYGYDTELKAKQKIKKLG